VKLWALLTAGCLLLASSADVRAQARGGRESSGSERRGNSETSREGRERAERGSRAGGSEAGRRDGRDNDRSAQGLASERQHDATRSGETNAEAKRKASETRSFEARSEGEPEGKPEAKPEPKPEAKPELKPEPNRTHSDHAVQRGKEGRRTGPAFGDAQKAKRPDVYKQRDGRYVVRGRNGREHIFEPDGTHKTSIDRTKAAHEGKVRSGERTPVTEQEYEEFKKIFQ
jgi:hypothetical protein